MDIKSCYLGPNISEEQFIPEHLFLFLIKGTISGYDGSNQTIMKSGEYCIVRKNHLARYRKVEENGKFEKVAVIFDEKFLRTYQQNYNPLVKEHYYKETFILPGGDEHILLFIESLWPYYEGKGRISKSVENEKRNELLHLLLKTQPQLSGLFFDFNQPEKLNLEEFMNKNFRFNVGLNRFAFLTGRSLSAFKRDFKTVFNQTPGRWLVEKRLQEAYFLIEQERKMPSEIYIDLGFEDFSHFSFAFKNFFGISPKRLLNKN